MPRVKDIAWKFVIRLEGDRWRCPHCENEYLGKVTRVKSHFLKIPNRGISFCTKVPEHISELMQWLLDQVRYKGDIAWKFVNRLGDNKWRCHYCSEEFSGDLTGVKCHLLKVPNEGISICTKVPDPVRTLMRPLLDEGAEEEESRDANGQSATEPQSRDVPTQAEVAEEENREANCQFAEEPQTPSFSQESFELLNRLIPAPEEATDMANFTSDQQQGEHQIHQSLTMLSLTQNSHGESISRSTMALEEAEAESYLLDFPDQPRCSIRSQMQINNQQTPAGASSFQYDHLPAIGNSNCLQDCNQPSQLQTPMDIDPSIASQQTSDSHTIEATTVDLQVPEVATNTTGPSSSQASVPPQCQSVPHQSINLKTAHQNPIVPSSSRNNHLDTHHPQALMDPSIQSSSQAPNKAPPPPQIPHCETGLIGPSSLLELDMNEGAPMTSHPNTGNNFKENRALKRKLELYSREASIRNELEFAESLSIKTPRMEVANWLADVEKFRNDFPCTEVATENCLPPHQRVDRLMREAEDFSIPGKGLFEARETKFSKFLEGKMVGEAFQRNTTEILQYLVGNQVSRLGIYGMGGVGKTTIMKHIHNKLLEKPHYSNVFWITVSQDFHTQKLQDDIWQALGSSTLVEKDVSKRAAMLSNHLTKRGKSTIILDDVWKHFDLEEVGIPVTADGLKLVLTTRSIDVCHQMDCQMKIKIETLSQEEGESLFMEELGSKVPLNLETEKVVKFIVKECAGLPIGVITMARSMRGVTDVCEWRDSLVKLKESSVGQTDMEEKVLRNLKFSYDRLGNADVQQCFLSCALYPEDELIDKLELIEFFIDQELIGGLSTRKEQYDRGLTILNKLGNVCLLEAYESKMKMHDLIRDMALHIMSKTSIVKAGKRLSRIPPKEYWMDALEKVSLMQNHFIEFPLNMSPNCPKLSTLLLNDSLVGDNVIPDDSLVGDNVSPDSFFKNLLGLQVLNLSGCLLRELPNSISNLVNLRALLLRGCWQLCRIPYLGNLTSLRKLDMWRCSCVEKLEGLEMLVNLRYLDLTDTLIKRLAKGTLGDMPYLQYLKVGVVDGEDITKLRALETLECDFEDADDFNKCVRVIEQSNPRYYFLLVGQEKSLFEVEVSDDARSENWKEVIIYEWSHAIVSVGGECAGIFILIPRDVQSLDARNCDGITNLSSVGPLEYLELLFINKWENLQVLCGGQDDEVNDVHDSPAPTPTPLRFLSLSFLRISQCPKLKYLFGHGSKFYLPHLQEIYIRQCGEMAGITAAVTSPPPHPLPAFPSLTEIFVESCDKMKSVVESKWLPQFPNLKSIMVRHCENMEEIIRGTPCMPVEGISLESLEVYSCNNMRMLLPHEWLPHLRNLHEIKVESCKGMVEMISGGGHGQEGNIMTPVSNTPSSFHPSISPPTKLKSLVLCELPQLKSICEVSISCDFMETLVVYECPELKGIPLRLQLRDIKDLPYICVDNEEMWKMLIWDHPDAQAILQPYLRKGEHASVGRCYPNAIGYELIDIIASLLKSPYKDVASQSIVMQL